MGNEASKKADELKAKAKAAAKKKTTTTTTTASSSRTPAASSSRTPAATTSRTPAAGASRTPAAGASTSAPPAPAPQPTVITTTPMDKPTMAEMKAAVGTALQGYPGYNVVGGVAMTEFESQRGTKDLDLLVPENTVAAVVQKLVASGKFGAEKRSSGYQVWFKASNTKNYNVDVMMPSQIHPTFKFPTASISVGGVRVLAPAQLLNMKILAYMVRKKSNDAEDVLHMVQWMKKKGMKTNQKEVTYADDDFLTSFVTQKHSSSKANWVAIGLPPP